MSSRTQTGPRSDNGAFPDPEEITDFGELVDSLVTGTREYLHTERDLLAMNVQQRVAVLTGGLLSGVLVAVLGLGVLVFCNLALAIWLGGLLASMALGFLVVGGIYFLVFLAFWFIWRGGMKDRFTLNIINSFYDDKD